MDKKRGRSKLVIFLILIIILVGGCFLLSKENIFSALNLNSFEKLTSQTTSKMKEGLNNAVEKGDKTIDEASQGVRRKALDAFRNIAEKSLANIVNTAENFLGIESKRILLIQII